jgi:ATP-dependent DNA helicase RecQ
LSIFDSYRSNVNKSREILKKYWGFDSFRALQEDIVDSAIYGHDTFAILPTGGGKSICFQVPGIALEGVTLVISPLIALMQDQVNNLEKRGINASLITSALSYREIDISLDNARFGNTKFLYTSPERLKSDLFIERFKRMKIGLIVIDEAHCISEWGHDFRPSYREIAAIREYHPEAPIIAVTASATPKVQEDIVEQLKLKKPKKFVGSLQRENIKYSVRQSENKIGAIVDYCKANRDQTGIVYCQTRRSVKQIVTQLRAHKISAGIYHGGLNSEDRKYMLDQWMEGNIKVMVATNAFGMGIDKPNVRYVLHYEIPGNLEAYYQEAGRAGRDEQDAQAIAFWEEQDLDILKSKLIAKYPEKDRIKLIYNSISNFLKIAIGSGADETYPFNIQSFANTFEVGIGETYYALKILQLNGTINFTESSFHPTRLKIAVGNETLYKFQVSHEKVSSLISLITRSYAGVFDRFATIHEGELCKRLKINQKQLKERLEFLEQYGVIDITFQSQLPLVTYLHERLPDSHLSLSNDIYESRKKVEHEKLNSILKYVTGKECRPKMISEYFGDKTEDCGKCDNCKSRIGRGNDKLADEIMALLPANLNDLTSALECSAEDLNAAIRELILEEVIEYRDQVYKII